MRNALPEAHVSEKEQLSRAFALPFDANHSLWVRSAIHLFSMTEN